ncbi:hypothetical protein KV097_04430 [Mumia sp. zg.B17]|uniref:hypothetical protein n=1 Tax=Mumia sp. zg.B17 TaxID=2855446 RepID=UPI001C6DED45|nr:hypothetical protein [Mumia sp. zg.B17]MBW9205180.1 hypothetical protein [Mumia sp. zg.B17]
MFSLVIGAVGLTLVVLSGWSWRGRTRAARWWTRRTGGELLVLAFLPSLGLVLLGAGLAEIGSLSGLSSVLAILGALSLVLGLLVTGVGLLWWPAQRLWGPRWYTSQSAKGRWDALSDPFSSLAGRLGSGSTAAAPEPRWFGRAIASWRGGRVLDPDTRERPDAASRRGTVAGIVRLGEGGLWFESTGGPTTWSGRASAGVRWSEIMDVRVVPARAGADGRVRTGVLYRSWCRRLVVATADESYLYEISWGRAHAVADAIAQERAARPAR